MTHLPDNVYPLMRPRTARRGFTRGADMLTLRRLERWGPFWAATIFALLALSTSILIAAVLATVGRSGTDVFSRLIPGWPWFVTN